jgi:hypothetical protein
LPVRLLDDDQKLLEAIEKGEQDEQLLAQINSIHRRKTERDRRERPLRHDAGRIKGAQFLRSQKEKCWILTRDSIVKQYAIENIRRDDYPLAIGLDVLINMLAINANGVEINPSNFAPLFANLVQRALFPEKNAFTVEDLVTMHESNMEVTELPDKTVIEIAKGVNKERMLGKSTDDVHLYLQRSFQRAKFTAVYDLAEAKEKLHFVEQDKNKSERLNQALLENQRKKRTAELRDQYDKNLIWNRWRVFAIQPLLIVAFSWLCVHLMNLAENDGKNYWTLFASLVAEFFILAFMNYKFWEPKFVSKYSERITGIDSIVEAEIQQQIKEALP